MLTSLIGMGFDKDAAWQALKLSQFRSEGAAVDILLRSAAQRRPDALPAQSRGGAAARTHVRLALNSPSNPGLDNAPPHSDYPSPSDYSVRPYPSPLVHSVSAMKVERPSPQSLVNVVSVGNLRGMTTTPSPAQPTRVFSAQMHQDASSTVRIEVGSEGGRRYELEAASGETLLRFQAPQHGAGQSLGVQRISVGEPSHQQAATAAAYDRSYIENLLSRADGLIGSSPLGKRDSTASSTSESGGAAGESFAALMRGGRGSPGSTASTESSVEGPREAPARCVSPLPGWVVGRVEGRGEGEGPVKPCTPKAFKFFMEQHVENVIKQHTERQMRCYQLEQEMASANFQTSWRCQMKRLLAHKESHYLRRRRQRMNKDMFVHIKTIGIGAFGEVSLVRKNDTKALYAMKTLRKNKVIKMKQAAHVKAERDILSEAANEFIVKLYYSFQDSEHLFFIMEYIPGGDMMSLLIKKERFDEELARFYIAELVLAIESVHRLGFIHRDIKPDNIVIDKSGHIKLTDFGLCTGLRWTHDNNQYSHDLQTPFPPQHGREESLDLGVGADGPLKVLHQRQRRQRKRAHSLVGTPNYIAPEILPPCKGHTSLCDWWSVGVILFEMVVGYPPFHANTPAETQIKVMRWWETLQIPTWARLQPATDALIRGLLRGVEDRLGNPAAGGAEELKRQPYFASVDFAGLRQSRAPYIPEILHETDTSNFDPPEETPEPVLQKEAEPKETKPKGEHAFYEFTFRRFFDSDPQGCPTLRRTSPPSGARPSLAPLMEAGAARMHLGPPHPAPNISVLCINDDGQEAETGPGRPGIII